MDDVLVFCVPIGKNLEKWVQEIREATEHFTSQGEVIRKIDIEFLIKYGNEGVNLGIVCRHVPIFEIPELVDLQMKHQFPTMPQWPEDKYPDGITRVTFHFESE